VDNKSKSTIHVFVQGGSRQQDKEFESIKEPSRSIHKGRLQKRGSNADTCGHGGMGLKDLADVRKMALFKIVSAYFADTPYG